jgi:hypothetical protein
MGQTQSDNSPVTSSGAHQNAVTSFWPWSTPVTVVVTGACGSQGFEVAKALLTDPDASFKVRIRELRAIQYSFDFIYCSQQFVTNSDLHVVGCIRYAHAVVPVYTLK